MKESNCLLWFFCNLCCICKTEAANKLSLLVIFVNNLHGKHFFKLNISQYFSWTADECRGHDVLLTCGLNVKSFKMRTAGRVAKK